MKLRLALLLAIISLFAIGVTVWGQVDTAIGQFTNSPAEAIAGDISGDGRFVVFTSRGNIATENPRNEDNNLEVFLWDFAQRRIFQITNSKAVLINHFGQFTALNIRVDIINKRPVISNDGRWIAFASNAYSAVACGSNSVDPGNFDGNACTNPVPTPTPTGSPSPTPSATPNNNPLITDANMEIWLYQIPAYAPASLTSGEELPLTNLSGGAFTRITNTPASRDPVPASTNNFAFVAEDNRDPSISDAGEAVAFTSSRDIVLGGNDFPNNDNDEIFVFRQGGAISQITRTPRGTITGPIYSKHPSISGNAARLAFASTGENPVVPGPSPSPPFSCGSNPATSRNEEIFYVNLDASGAATACRQITTTSPTNPGDPVNIFDYGRRISRDGRFVAFDSYADLAGEHGGVNQAGFASVVFDEDITGSNNAFRRFLPRSNADAAAAGGDIPRFPTFSDYDGDLEPSTIVFETRLNIKPNGTMAATDAEGLNPDPQRPTQIYRTKDLLPQLTGSPTPPSSPNPAATYTRLTKFPISTTVLAFTRPLASNTSDRIAFDLPLTELGTGNPDGQKEVYYLYVPEAINPAVAVFSFATGASRIPVSASPVPTPSPTATPTPSPTPTGSPSPVPTPTPVTPPAVQGLSPGSLAILTYSPSTNQPVVAVTAVGSINRSFTLPITLSGVTMTINGVAVGLKSVSRHQIVFVVPPRLSSTTAGTVYPVVVNNNGTVFKGSITIVPVRPDIFTNLEVPGPGGRAQAFNVTNRVHTTEPFTVTTIRIRGGQRVPSVIRLRVTGMANISDAERSVISVRIGNVTIQGPDILTGTTLVEPGVYTFDFRLPPTLNMAGDQPIVVTVTLGGITYTSRLDDTAPRIFIL